MNLHDTNVLMHLLWALPVFVLLIAWARRRRRIQLTRMVEDPEIRVAVTASVSGFKRRTRQVLFLLAIVLIVVAAARPTWGSRLVKRSGSSRDVLVVLDTSRSMLAKDIKPTRLDHGKWFVRQLLEQLPGDRFGLVAFAGDAFLECPLTRNYSGFLLFLEDIDTNTIPIGGTDLEKALEAAFDAFKASEGLHRGVVVITDGDELQGKAAGIVKKFKEQKIPIYTVGLGDTGSGSYIQLKDNSFVTDPKGQRVRTRLNESVLKGLSAGTGGAYVHSTALNDRVDQIAGKIRMLVPQDGEESTVAKPIEHYQLPLFMGVLCLLVRMILGERKSQGQDGRTAAEGVSVRSGKAAAAQILTGLLLLATSAAPAMAAEADSVSPTPADADAEHAAESAQTPGSSLIDRLERKLSENANPKARRRMAYNLALKHQQSDESSEAETGYLDALDGGGDDVPLRAAIHQNLGVLKHNDALAAMEEAPEKALEILKEAQDLYRLALLNGADPDGAGKNLELALKHQAMIEQQIKNEKEQQAQKEQLQKDIEEALEEQKKANQAQEETERNEQQKQAAEKTERAKEDAQKLADEMAKNGDPEGAETIKQASDALSEAGEQQDDAMANDNDAQQQEAAGRKAEELLKEALSKVRGDDDAEKTAKNDDGESPDNSNKPDQPGDQADETPKEGGEEGPETAEAGDEITTEMALRIFKQMGEREQELKQRLKARMANRRKASRDGKNW